MKDLEDQIILFYNSLPEIAKRRYVALECLKGGSGSKTYYHNLLGCAYATIVKGIQELNNDNIVPFCGSRKAGGGSANKADNALVMSAFLRVIESSTAGTPTSEEAKWTYLGLQQIADLMKLEGVSISPSVVKKLLKKFGYVKRKSQKKTP